MNCNDCYWCTRNSTDDENFVCCKQESENYNKVLTPEETETTTCEEVESQQAVDYRNMTPWQFASKYYM